MSAGVSFSVASILATTTLQRTTQKHSTVG
jgi:hypothetical protein